MLSIGVCAGFTPLHLAASSCNLKCVKILTLAGADVNVQDGKSGSTALHHAVENDNLPIIGYLILEVSVYSLEKTHNWDWSAYDLCEFCNLIDQSLKH